MIRINKHIQIVRAQKTSLSSMGKKSCDMIYEVLNERYEHVGVSIIDEQLDLDILVAKQPNLSFLGLKLTPVGASSKDQSPAKVWVSDYLDKNGLDYTGSASTAIALDFNKPAAKQVVKAAGLNTSAHFVAKPGQYNNENELPLMFPLFIKPPHTGGGKGIGADSVVRNFTAYEKRVDFIASTYKTGSLVEEYLTGREFSVAILKDINTNNLMAMPIELTTEQNEWGDRILGQKVKHDDTEHIIAVTDLKLKQAIAEHAIAAFKALGARDYGRIDIRLDSRGVPYFLEANLIPGLAQHDFTSYFTKACFINQAMDYKTMILHIVNLGLARNANVDNSVFEYSTPTSAILPFFKPALDSAQTIFN